MGDSYPRKVGMNPWGGVKFRFHQASEAGKGKFNLQIHRCLDTIEARGGPRSWKLSLGIFHPGML